MMSAASTTARAAPAPLHSRADYSLQCVSNMNSAARPSSSPPAPRRRSSTPTTSPSPSPPKSQSQSHRQPHPHYDQRVPTLSPTKQTRAIPPPTMDSEMTNANNINDQQNQYHDEPMPHQQHPQQDDGSNNCNGLRKELDMRLAAYLPAVVRRHLEQQDTLRVPDTHETTVVSMFADVSGFTAMTESLAARGPVGAEFLGRYLNSYFEQLLRHVSSAGGDVFKFAGDAMLIFWPENKDDTLESLLRRAVQCALRIQSHLHKAEFAPGVVLSVKMGIGIGGATIAHLGGVSDGAIDRMEYIAVGPALEQAFSAEHQAEAGQVICSPQCWKMVGKYFDGEPVRLGSPFQKVTAVNLPIKLVSRRASYTRDDPQLQVRMKQYVSRAVWPYLDAHDELWGSELRDVTVLFINVGFSEDDLAKMLDVRGLERLQDAFQIVQKCIYEYEGTINKFLVDDKGSTVIAAFGLPPVTHENDPIRGILSSLAICAALGNMGLKASVGITTGVALCGVVGHQGNRREYTVLGDIVNLSARLMQKAKSENGGVITDETTKLYTHDVLHFEKRPEIFVKGKNDSIQIHRPYPRMSILSEYHSASTRATGARKNAMTLSLPLSPRAAASPGKNVGGAVPTTQIQNVMESMHRVQVRDAQRRISLRAEEQAANAPAIIESDSFLKIRDTLVQACSQLNRFANGGSFILEGDIGVGKTVLLRTALLSASPEIGCYNVCMGTASPFATRKPYAVWADIISKCALEGYMDSSATGSHSGLCADEAGGSTMHSVQMSDFSKEAERRRRVATFVRRKIRDGAAPNTTLVRYAYLLNNILDTNFEEFIDEEPASNNDDEPAHSFGSSATMRPHRAATDVTSPSKMHVKEEDIAAWFLGLLEMDLACSRRNSEDCLASGVEPGSTRRSTTRHADRAADGVAGHVRAAVSSASSSSSSASSASSSSDEGTHADQQQQRESEWKPTELDTSGILLLCALHAMSRDKVTVFCLDNAMFMDEKSWVLTTIIAKYFTNCMVIVSTRPPSLSLGEHTQSSSFRKRLRVLKRMQPSVSVAMEPLAPTEIHQLALQILQVQVIPSELVTILISRSQGNPLFLHEIIGEMLQQQVIKKDESRYRCYLQVQEAWGDKSRAPSCFYCYIKFTTPKDKFRCESCGYLFCSACTPTACRKKLPGSTGDPVRHCSNCYSSPAATAIAAGTVASGRGFGKSKQKLSKQPAVQSSLEDRIALRPPKTVKSVLTTLLDQLSVSQRMIMKTASVVGSVFEEELLRGTSPIKAHLGQFQQDLADLERLAMIRRMDTFIAGLKKASTVPSLSEVGSTTMTTPRPPSLKVKYEFCHGFMQDVIRSQLLGSQLAKLKARCNDCREHQEKMVRQCFIERVKAVHGNGPAPSVAVAARRGSNPHNIPLAVSSTRRRSLTSIGDEYDGGESRRGSSQLYDAPSGRRASARASSSASRDDSVLNLAARSLPQQQHQRTLKIAAAFNPLKTDTVFVKKQSSLFSHLKFKGLTNARLWKKRFAVLHHSRLTLQYDEVSGSKPRQGTSLFLRGAKVSACDPEVASKVNCFQVEVNEWTKGKYLMNQKRFFVMGVQSEAEVENWVYMIRYAIESLETHSQ